MKWIATALAGILLLELGLATLYTGSWIPLLYGLAGAGVLGLSTAFLPRIVHLVGFMLSAFLLGLWWNALMDMEYFGWPMAAAMAMHVYALSIALACLRHPDDQRLRSDTQWVFGSSFAMTFIAAYLVFSGKVVVSSPWLAGGLGASLIGLNFLLLEFSRVVNQAKPWLRTPANLMRSGLFLLLLATVLTTSFLASSFISRRMPAAMDWVRQGVETLRGSWEAFHWKETAAVPPSERLQRMWARSMMREAGVVLGNGPSTGGFQQEVFYLEIDDPASFERMRGRQMYVRTRADDEFDLARGLWRNGSRVEPRRLGDTNGDGVVQVARPVQGVPAVKHRIIMAEPNATVHALVGLRQIETDSVTSLDDGWFRFSGNPSNVYEVVSQPVTYGDVGGEPLVRQARAPRRFLELPQTGQAPAEDVIRRIAAVRRALQQEHGGRSLNDHIEYCVDFLRSNYTYSLTVEESGLEAFFFKHREGYCTYFATALALMLRDAGIPTRVGMGYSGGEIRPGTNWIVFSGKHAHAWTEVWTDKYGWIVVDATPPGPDVPGAPVPERVEEEPAEETASGPDAAAVWTPPPHFMPVMLLVACLLGLAGLLLFSQRAPVPEANVPVRRPVPNYFKLFCRTFAKHGYARPPGATPREYLQSLRQAGAAGAEFEPLVDYYYHVMYQDGGRSPERERGFARMVKRHRVPKPAPPAPASRDRGRGGASRG